MFYILLISNYMEKKLTTIQVDEDIIKELKLIKKYRRETYNEVIMDLIKNYKENTRKLDIDTIKAHITPILDRYGIKHASIFGSYARGEAREDSDIDILVELPESFTLLDFAGLKLDLEKSLGKTVDLVTFNGIYPALKDSILKTQVIVR